MVLINFYQGFFFVHDSMNLNTGVSIIPNRGKNMEVIPDVHMIEGITAHCYLIADSELILIDTGLPHQTQKILRYITNGLHRDPSELKTIFLTHADVDHIGNASELRSLTGAKIAAHPEDAEIITGVKERLMPKGGMSILLKLVRSVMRTKPFQVDLLVNDGDEIAGLRIIHLPGHTPGSIALYDSRRKTLFVGDALGYKRGDVQGPSEEMTMDLNKAYESIVKLTAFDFDVLLSGHGEPLQSAASVKVKEFLEKRTSPMKGS